MTTEVRETEQKYEVEGDVALPSLADLPVARIETRRRLTTLLDATGASLAEIAVDGGG